VRARAGIVVILVAALLSSGCGETISADQRVERCLSKQPDSTKSECEKWEKDGELEDNGVHKEHEE
jgi:hypothetical protein